MSSYFGFNLICSFFNTQGDLFASSSSASLAHCVSKDLHMGKGIATVFKKKFGGVGELKSQGKFELSLLILFIFIIVYCK